MRLLWSRKGLSSGNPRLGRSLANYYRGQRRVRCWPGEGSLRSASVSFAPSGLCNLYFATQCLRPGLYPCAAPRLWPLGRTGCFRTVVTHLLHCRVPQPSNQMDCGASPGLQATSKRKPYERHAGSLASWRRGRAALSADSRPRQACRHFRRNLSHHRRHSFQLRQLRPAAGLHPHPIQGAVAEPARPRRLEHHGQRDGRVHRSAAAHEAGERPVVPGHGRRGVPEHLFDRLGAAQACAHPVRRSHLQDELRPDAGAAQRLGRGRDPGHDPDRSRRGLALRSGGRGSRPPGAWVSKRSRRPPSCARRRIPKKFPPRWASICSIPMCSSRCS